MKGIFSCYVSPHERFGRPGNAKVDLDAATGAVADRIATPRSRAPLRIIGARRRTEVISVTVSGPYLASISRHLRQLKFELWRGDLTRLGGEAIGSGEMCPLGYMSFLG